jgi:hypothetical protein
MYKFLVLRSLENLVGVEEAVAEHQKAGELLHTVAQRLLSGHDLVHDLRGPFLVYEKLGRVFCVRSGNGQLQGGNEM